MNSHALDLLYSSLATLPLRRESGVRSAVLDAVAHPGLRELAGRSSVECVQSWKPAVDALVAKGFVVSETLSGEYDLALFCGGKFRDFNLYLFALGASKLVEGGTFLCSMPNELGAGRFEKHLRELFGEVESNSKHKCRVFWGVKGAALNATVLQEWLALGAPHTIEGTTFVTVPGIFSSHEIDDASRLLVDHLPPSLTGRGADLGSGWGFLSASVCERCSGDFSIDLYEADRRALECAQLNLTSYSKRVSFHWADVLQGLGRNDYQWIIMNPPFHDGHDNAPHIGQRFIEVAGASLAPGGELFMVANNHLPYRSALERHLPRHTVVAEEGGFRVWRAIK